MAGELVAEEGRRVDKVEGRERGRMGIRVWRGEVWEEGGAMEMWERCCVRTGLAVRVSWRNVWWC